jgi:two-component system, OmpR family, alkaline phosphatase synthesis response regulator PhoP
MLRVVVKSQPSQVILLIEDDGAIARMYQTSLREHGYEVRLARDGEAGLAAIRSLRPELVLLDVRLPKLDGIQVLERLQADPELRNTKVVMLSNQGMDETVRTSLRLGALDYVTKATVTPRELAQLIARYLVRN